MPTSNNTGDSATSELLRQIRDEQMQTRLAVQQIAKSRVVRASIGTISTAILIAMILWALLFGSLYIGLAAMAEADRRERMLSR